MANRSAYTSFRTLKTPQSEPVPGEKMVKNKAGGYAFQADDWTILRRFLILGTDGGTYYTKPTELTRENATVVLRCLKQDYEKTVQMIVEVSDGGLAPKNDAALFALAMVSSLGDEPARKAALDALPKVARIPTHLFDFATYAEQFRGWGRGLRKSVGSWYTSKDEDELAHLVVKYRQRNGWTNADLIRLSHPSPTSEGQNTIFKWTLDKLNGEENYVPGAIQAFESLKNAKTSKEVCQILRSTRLTWEAVPTEFHKEPAVWEVLLETMPAHALVRNLGRFANLGMTNSNLSDVTMFIVDRLQDGDWLRRARMHPMKMLVALRTYQKGKGEKGSLTWNPNQKIADAMNDAFYLLFHFVQPTGKNILLAVDESGSMTHEIANMPMNCYEAAMSMAFVMAKTEPNVDLIGFDTSVHPMNVSPGMRLDQALSRGAHGGGTDCGCAFNWALREGGKTVKYDAIGLLTDSESWAGGQHVFQWADEYRRTVNPDFRFFTFQMAATQTSLHRTFGEDMSKKRITKDLEVVGLDTSAFDLVSPFIRGEF